LDDMVRLVYTGRRSDRSKRDAIWFGDKILQAVGVTRRPMESKQTGAGRHRSRSRETVFLSKTPRECACRGEAGVGEREHADRALGPPHVDYGPDTSIARPMQHDEAWLNPWCVPSKRGLRRLGREPEPRESFSA
jgi:hypothetical protein